VDKPQKNLVQGSRASAGSSAHGHGAGGEPTVQQGKSTLACHKTSSGMSMGTNLGKQRDEGTERAHVVAGQVCLAMPCDQPAQSVLLSHQTAFLTISLAKGCCLQCVCVWGPDHQPLVSKPGLRGPSSLVQPPEWVSKQPLPSSRSGHGARGWASPGPRPQEKVAAGATRRSRTTARATVGSEGQLRDLCGRVLATAGRAGGHW